MDMQKILSSLCYYDKRNPDCTSDDDVIKHKKCFCDNCFYGRTPLAEEIINLKNILDGKHRN
jgi:hypothetical protein